MSLLGLGLCHGGDRSTVCVRARLCACVHMRLGVGHWQTDAVRLSHLYGARVVDKTL